MSPPPHPEATPAVPNVLPTVSVVVPSFNQAEFLPVALESVLTQEGCGEEFALEVVVMDGGSTDGSAEIVVEFAGRFPGRLVHWESGPDGGHYAALNAGFGKTGGGPAGVMGWLNSDDRLCPWALRTVAGGMRDNPDCDWLTSARPLWWTRGGAVSEVGRFPALDAGAVLRGCHLPGGRPFLGYLQQESTFWRRRLWDAVARTDGDGGGGDGGDGGGDGGGGGALRTRFKLAADHDLWVRFAAAGARLDAVPAPLGGFRFQPGQRSADQEAYVREAREALADVRRRRGDPPAPGAGFLSRTLGPRLGGLADRLRYRRRFAGRLFRPEDPYAAHTRWVPRTVRFP